MSINFNLKSRAFSDIKNDRGETVIKAGETVEISNGENPNFWIKKQTKEENWRLINNFQFFINWQTLDIVKERWCQGTMELNDFTDMKNNLSVSTDDIIKQIKESEYYNDHQTIKDIGWKTYIHISADIPNPAGKGVIRAIIDEQNNISISIINKQQLEQDLFTRTGMKFNNYTVSQVSNSRLDLELNYQYRMPGDADSIIFNRVGNNWQPAFILENKRSTIKANLSISEQDFMRYYNNKSVSGAYIGGKTDRAKYDRLMRLRDVLNCKLLVCYHTDEKKRQDYKYCKFHEIEKTTDCKLSDYMKVGNKNVCKSGKSVIYIKDDKHTDFAKTIFGFAGLKTNLGILHDDLTHNQKMVSMFSKHVEWDDVEVKVEKISSIKKPEQPKLIKKKVNIFDD